MTIFIFYGFGIASVLFTIIVTADWIFGDKEKDCDYPYGIKRYDK